MNKSTTRPESEKRQEHQKHVAIIGAGIVGVSTAIWLQRSGHQVTLIDAKGPAGGTSYGNAGVLAACSIVPVTVPGLIFKAPKMLFSKDGPLFMRWSNFPRLIPFLLRYLRHGNTDDVSRIADGLALLLQDTADQHVATAKGTPAESHISVGDYVFGYADRAAYEGDAYGWGCVVSTAMNLKKWTLSGLQNLTRPWLVVSDLACAVPTMDTSMIRAPT